MRRLVIALVGAATLHLAGAARAEDAAQRGKYLATIMDCDGCHNGAAFTGRPDPALYLAGSGVGFAVPGLGVFYPPNLTPDPETGLGTWSPADIVKALRTGERPDGRVLAPAMPWPAYAKLTDADAMALATFLKSLPPAPPRRPAAGRRGREADSSLSERGGAVRGRTATGGREAGAGPPSRHRVIT